MRGKQDIIMTNKELQEYLKEFPDDMKVVVDRNGSIYTTPSKPFKKFMGTSQEDYIVLTSDIRLWG